ncbi:hypothetical protein C3J73_28825, partial [Klebsiella pneumoniae subsp. pneumoniae]
RLRCESQEIIMILPQVQSSRCESQEITCDARAKRYPLPRVVLTLTDHESAAGAGTVFGAPAARPVPLFFLDAFRVGVRSEAEGAGRSRTHSAPGDPGRVGAPVPPGECSTCSRVFLLGRFRQ